MTEAKFLNQFTGKPCRIFGPEDRDNPEIIINHVYFSRDDFTPDTPLSDWRCVFAAELPLIAIEKESNKGMFYVFIGCWRYICECPDVDYRSDKEKESETHFVNTFLRPLVSSFLEPTDIEQIADLPKGETFQVDTYKGSEKLNTNQDPYYETDEEYAFRVSIGKLLIEAPRGKPIQVMTDPPYEAPIFANDSGTKSLYFEFGFGYRIKPAPVRRVRKLSEIIAEAEKQDRLAFVDVSDGSQFFAIELDTKEPGDKKHVIRVYDVAYLVGMDERKSRGFQVPVLPDWFFEDVPDGETSSQKINNYNKEIE